MTGLLLDTNVVSELRKPTQRINPNVRAWAAGIDSDSVFLSVITISELSHWVASVRRKDPVQGSLLEGWLHDDLLAEYATRIIPIDVEVAMIAGPLHVPDPRDYRDAFIAACALRHQLTVVTRNVHDFAPMGVRLVNPFDFRIPSTA